MWGAPQWEGGEQERLSPGHGCWEGGSAVPQHSHAPPSSTACQHQGHPGHWGCILRHTGGSTEGPDPSCFHPELGNLAVVAWNAAWADCPEAYPISQEGLAVGHVHTIQVPPVPGHTEWNTAPFPPGTFSNHMVCLPWQDGCIIVHVPFIAQYRGKRSDQMFQFVCQGDKQYHTKLCKPVQTPEATSPLKQRST